MTSTLPAPVRIIGIDPGSRYTGFGIIEKEDNRLRHVYSGVVDSSKLETLEDKLVNIFEGLSTAIEEFKPSQGSIERIFHSVNAKSSLILGHARGVALLALKIKGLSVYEYAPNEIKSAITGVGRASKDQVAYMVQVLLNYKVKMKEDESDALAAAICHANTHPLSRLIKN